MKMIDAYYKDDFVTVYHCDCTEIAPLLPMFDLLLTDPPYGIDASTMTMGMGRSKLFTKGEWDSQRPDITWLLSSASMLCVWGGNYFTDQLPVTNDWLCWYKKNDGRGYSEFELAWTNFGTKCRIKSLHWGSVDPKIHITQKPLPVIEWCLSFVPSAKTVFDPYAGSGTTGVACKKQRISCVLIERDESYCKIIADRLRCTEPMMDIVLPQRAETAQQGMGL